MVQERRQLRKSEWYITFTYNQQRDMLLYDVICMCGCTGSSPHVTIRCILEFLQSGTARRFVENEDDNWLELNFVGKKEGKSTLADFLGERKEKQVLLWKCSFDNSRKNVICNKRRNKFLGISCHSNLLRMQIILLPYEFLHRGDPDMSEETWE